MALTAADVSFSYDARGGMGAKDILRGFSATFHSGAITAVTGPNGSGKTTLARLLVGILKPRAGEISIDGVPVSGLTLTEVGKRVGIVMQDPCRQIFTTSVWDEMMFGLENIGISKSDAEQLSGEYLSLFGLSDKMDCFPFELSTGERQRLVLAAVLAAKPAYLILDEPTSSLDIGRRKTLGGYLSEIRDRDGVGVVLISHDARFVDEHADSVITLSPCQVGAGEGSA
ncbi:MAG: energy-coupling factor ABC transporter ATP-binding protein [Clostridiales Family XIII bacterium]|jgi:energy-coupling factor transport system ATP-binding protein|nr:energy-coupling factor ABC transporter ATP-binding protein [Clostridiales Family XIII bacterium]